MILDLTPVTRVQETFDLIAELLDVWVYAEDLQGRLLFSSANARSDLWRSDYTPFSVPCSRDSEKLLTKWRGNIRVYEAQHIELGLGEYRVIVSLSYRGEVFALVHFVSLRRTLVDTIHAQPELVKSLGDKLYIVIMGAMNEVRRQYLLHVVPTEPFASWNEPEQQNLTFASQLQVFTAHFGNIPTEDFQHEVIDYGALAVHHARSLLIAAIGAHLDAKRVEFRTLHRREDRLQAVIVARYLSEAPELPTLVAQAIESQLKSYEWRASVAVSSLFRNPDEAADRIEQAFRINDLGEKQHGEGSLFTQRSIGLSAFILPLVRTTELQQFAREFLGPLRNKDQVLFETLRIYLACDCNATRTASYFAVDRRTITYRLGRISDELDLDMGSLESRVFLFLALQAADVIER